MHISKLTLVNYRNFKNTSLRFHKGVNTIIGENGSGKSNYQSVDENGQPPVTPDTPEPGYWAVQLITPAPLHSLWSHGECLPLKRPTHSSFLPEDDMANRSAKASQQSDAE